MSVVGNPEKLEQIVGRPIPREIFEFIPWGRRLVVLREEALRMTGGGLHIPDTAQQPLAQGWVISCGHLVGDAATPAGPCGGAPLLGTELIGRKVLFGKYAGTTLQTGDPLENEWEGQFVLLTDGDLWGEVQ